MRKRGKETRKQKEMKEKERNMIIIKEFLNGVISTEAIVIKKKRIYFL